jgi:hypothetical protein
MENIQQISNQNDPILTPTPQQTSQNKTSLLALTIIISFVGVTGYFGYQNYQLKQQIVNQQPLLTPTPVTTIVNNPIVTSIPITIGVPTSATDPTANWKTYENKQYGFSFKYPQQFITKIETDGGNMGWWSVTVIKIVDNSYESIFGITDRGGVNTNYQDWYKQHYANYKNFDLAVKKQRIGNIDVFAFLEPGMGDGDFSYGISSPDNKTYFIYTTPNRIETDPLFNQILSTFKFSK